MTVQQIVEITDHSTLGRGRLHQQYKDMAPTLSAPSIGPDLVTGWDALLNALIVPAQEFETIANEMLNERSLDLAEGVNLDRIGQIVGLSRNGLTDEDYSTLLVGQIAENNSDSTARDLLGIATILLGVSLRQLGLAETFPAKVTMEYFAEIQFLITSANNALTVQTDFGGGSPLLPVVLPDGEYFPFELTDLIQDLVALAWGQPLQVDFTASREYQFLLDSVPVLTDPAINWGTAGPLYGFTDGQTIQGDIQGAAVADAGIDVLAVQDALDSAKAAGVELQTQLVQLGNYFGFSNDPESLGFGALTTIVIGGGTYSTII